MSASDTQPASLEMIEGNRFVGCDNHVYTHVLWTHRHFARSEHLLSERERDLYKSQDKHTRQRRRKPGSAQLDSSPKRGFAVPWFEAKKRGNGRSSPFHARVARGHIIFRNQGHQYGMHLASK